VGDASEYGRPQPDLLTYLSPAVRWACAVLIRRQVRVMPLRTSSALGRYGPAGTAHLCAARAFLVYVFLISLPGVAFALLGAGGPATAFLALGWVAAAFCIVESAISGRAGRKWRAEEQAHA